MQRKTYRTSLTALSVGFLLFLTMAARLPAADSGKPLSKQEVLELLQGGVPSARVGELVDNRGMDFDLTPQIEREVRDAGGADDLVAALQRASQRRAASDHNLAGSLIIKTTPGEAQIYLNDEPKGMSGAQGDIRLPNLKPGSYNLRVSLPGYKSYEKPVAVTAGEAQTVDATLLPSAPNDSHKEPTAPSEPAPRATTTEGIPIPGLKTPTVQFYEGPNDPTPDHDSRVYRYSFDRFRARTIYWELDLTYPAPGQRVDFQVEAVWYKPDGSEMSRQNLAAHVAATWGSSWHTLGYGFPEAGHWTPGTYRVDFRCRNSQVASGTFQIN